MNGLVKAVFFSVHTEEITLLAKCMREVKNCSFLKANTDGFKQALAIMHTGGSQIRKTKLISSLGGYLLMLAAVYTTINRFGTA